MSHNYLDDSREIDGGYGRSVRLRLKEMGVTFAFLAISVLVIWVLWKAYPSKWMVLGAAAVCGGLSMALFPTLGESLKPSTRREFWLWCLVMGPAVALNGWSALHLALNGGDLFKAGAAAGMFGALIGGTAVLLADSRARVEGPTLPTSDGSAA